VVRVEEGGHVIIFMKGTERKKGGVLFLKREKEPPSTFQLKLLEGGGGKHWIWTKKKVVFLWAHVRSDINKEGIRLK